MVLLQSAGTSSGGESPIKDTYSLEIVKFGDLEEREARRFRDNEPDKINIQSRVEFRIIEFEYDPELDTRDWDGEIVSEFMIFQKKELDADGAVKRVLDSYLDKRSAAFNLLTAILGREPTRADELDLSSYEGTRLTATIEPKESGWPKVHNFAPYRRRRGAGAATPVRSAQPAAVQEDDDPAPAKGLGVFEQARQTA